MKYKRNGTKSIIIKVSNLIMRKRFINKLNRFFAVVLVFSVLSFSIGTANTCTLSSMDVCSHQFSLDINDCFSRVKMDLEEKISTHCNCEMAESNVPHDWFVEFVNKDYVKQNRVNGKLKFSKTSHSIEELENNFSSNSSEYITTLIPIFILVQSFRI